MFAKFFRVASPASATAARMFKIISILITIPVESVVFRLSNLLEVLGRTEALSVFGRAHQHHPAHFLGHLEVVKKKI
jgi:hypothetical protein